MQKQYFYIVLVVGIYLESVGSDDEMTPTTEGQLVSQGNETEDSDDKENLEMDHTFVALIDIVYTDGSKRSCTGAIIDDTVVITAAHCFVVKSDPEAQPELTASFVVIGTKKMFDTGYEQYLPIERVLTHPQYHDWTADVALVYTFAAMTADKPGTIITLAGDISSTAETNVTVFSWGRYGDGDNFSTKSIIPQTTKQDSCEDTSGLNNGDEASRESKEYQVTSYPKHDDDNGGNRKTFLTKSIIARMEKQGSYEDTSGLNNRDEASIESREYQVTTYPKHGNDRKTFYDKLEPKDKGSYEAKLRHNVDRSRTTKSTTRFHQRTVEKPTKVMSRYLASDDEQKQSTRDKYEREDLTFRTRNEEREPLPIARDSLDSYLESIWNKLVSTQIVTKATTHAEIETSDTSLKLQYKNWRRQMPTQTQIVPKATTHADIETSDTSLKLQYKNWRRQMPTQQNSLVVEIFSFIGNQACKKLIEKGMSSHDDISQQKDFVCYASEDYSITDRDSGAPAVLHGELIAVTLGGLQCDADHVGFGMKLACFCSWIAENVPNGRNMTCCKHCCGKHDKKKDSHKNVKTNKYLLR